MTTIVEGEQLFSIESLVCLSGEMRYDDGSLSKRAQRRDITGIIFFV